MSLGFEEANLGRGFSQCHESVGSVFSRSGTISVSSFESIFFLLALGSANLKKMNSRFLH